MSHPYAEVIGDPIAHSKSPLIHGFWLEKLGIEAEYRRCHVRTGEVESYFHLRRDDLAWRGCNVTIPHKVEVLEHIDGKRDEVGIAGAANTVFRDGGKLAGANTDIAGILAALPQDLMPPGAKVCILGTGGASRAALAACRMRDIASVVIAARNREAGSALLRKFDLTQMVVPLDDVDAIGTADVIINATSLGMVGQPAMPQALLQRFQDLNGQAVAFDMVYSPLRTEFLRAAAGAGCRTVDGLAMLIGQAAAAFELFFGRAAPRAHDAELRALLTA